MVSLFSIILRKQNVLDEKWSRFKCDVATSAFVCVLKLFMFVIDELYFERVLKVELKPRKCRLGLFNQQAN